jgi:UDP-N-acetyl-D-mannosaminuronic acid transferase (WecB/TagA/CpsF family)
VTLNTSKTQKVRVFLLGADGKVVESKDITIQKPYVKEETVDLNTLTFA